ncbi:nucleotidyltransferase family protein [Bradyrhizobium erythrophlei]|uniref:nucleotidyltransferase family protein n=1 Tax=Bradyrhizobium erythrophlei TaxID=1437360 RepID=UPI0035F08834
MDMRDEWVTALENWAANNESVAELWLFGSRAKNTSRHDSDIDIALLMMPPIGKTNWALANYVENFDEWKAQLRDAVDWPISLVAIGPKEDMDKEVRRTGIRSLVLNRACDVETAPSSLIRPTASRTRFQIDNSTDEPYVKAETALY